MDFILSKKYFLTCVLSVALLSLTAQVTAETFTIPDDASPEICGFYETGKVFILHHDRCIPNFGPIIGYWPTWENPANCNSNILEQYNTIIFHVGNFYDEIVLPPNLNFEFFDKTIMISLGGDAKKILTIGPQLQLDNLKALAQCFLDSPDIDGIDFDIEAFEPQDDIHKNFFKSYLKTIQEVHDLYPNKIISIALNGATISLLKEVNTDISEFIDYALLMGYDYGYGDSCSTPNSPMNPIFNDLSKIKTFFPAKDIFLLLPFYNRNGFGNNATWPWSAGRPIRSQDDSPWTIYTKAQLASTNGYGGVGAWEICQDDKQGKMSQALKLGFFQSTPNSILDEDYSSRDFCSVYYNVDKTITDFYTGIILEFNDSASNVPQKIIISSNNLKASIENYFRQISPIYEIEQENVNYNGDIKICIPYDEKYILNSEDSLQLWHGKNGIWFDITYTRDTKNNHVCGITDSLSPFILVEPYQGDLNNDGIIDRNDVNIVLSHRNESAQECPECDIDGDGTITVLDARKLITMCTCPRCVCAH